MIVDDEPDTVEMVELLLKKEGYEVITANCGKECLDKLNSGREGTPDLILLDIMMPKLTGWDVLRKIRAKRKFDSVKIIFLSVKSPEEYERHAEYKKCYSTYITKPFEHDELIEKIGKRIEK